MRRETEMRRERKRSRNEKRRDTEMRRKEKRRAEKSEETPYLSEHNVEGKHLKEKVTSDRQNLLLLFILFLDVAISRVIKVQSENKRQHSQHNSTFPVTYEEKNSLTLYQSIFTLIVFQQTQPQTEIKESRSAGAPQCYQSECESSLTS